MDQVTNIEAEAAINKAIEIACELIRRGISLRTVAAKLGMLQSDLEAFLAARPDVLLKFELAHADNEISLIEKREELFNDPTLPATTKVKLISDQLKTRPEHAPAPSVFVQRNLVEIDSASDAVIPTLVYVNKDESEVKRIKDETNAMNSKS